MKRALALAMLWLVIGLPGSGNPAYAITADEQALLRADRAAFGSGRSYPTLNEKVLDPDFTWTDSSGKTLNKSEILRMLSSGKGLARESGGIGDESKPDGRSAATAQTHGVVGLVQEDNGKVYSLRAWIRRATGWNLLLYQAVSIGAPPSADTGNGTCENPCNTVPFQPRNEDEREVIHAYQAVERAVTAHDSAAWGAHIADEFFAVTSNSDRPVDKAKRMAGLNNQKVGGIAPFPLVSARMFEFGDVMVMTSRQQPQRGLPLHVTRVWFKRKGVWLEAYSYQTTIQAAHSTQ
jgi:hypothetical protein